MLPNLSGLSLPTGTPTMRERAAAAGDRVVKAGAGAVKAAGNGLARLNVVVSDAAKQLVQPLIDDIAPKVKLSAKMSREDAQRKTLELAKLLHEKLLAMGKTKVPWEKAEATLVRIMNTPKPPSTSAASLGGTVLPTGADCDDKQYAEKHPEACESIAEAMVWQVIWCFVMYLLDTNPEMNHVGCAGFA